jgi:hypothetical protein
LAPPQAISEAKAPEDPLVVKLREEVKVPEEHIESLKSIILKVKAATKSDPKELMKILKELKNHYACTSLKLSRSNYWPEQVKRFKSEEVPEIPTKPIATEKSFE